MEKLRKKYEEEKLLNLKKQEENGKKREEELVRMLVRYKINIFPLFFLIFLNFNNKLTFQFRKKMKNKKLKK
jgi:hypothetical protein